MSNPPDFTELARQYLDLWEDQLTAMAADPELAAQTARFFDAMGRMGLAANPMAAAGMGAFIEQMSAMAGVQSEQADESGTARTAPRTPPAAAPPGDRDERLDELARRLADVEERLAGLEAGNRRTGRAPAKKPSGGRKRS